MSEVVFIGLDPATHCGWAVLDERGTRLGSGVWSLERRSGDGAGMVFIRFTRLFNELLDGYPNALVGYEQALNRFAGSALIGGGIISHVQRICEERGVPYTGVSFSAVKKHATGKGNCGKKEMVLAALHRWPDRGGSPLTDDEADALHVADFVREGLA